MQDLFITPGSLLSEGLLHSKPTQAPQQPPEETAGYRCSHRTGEATPNYSLNHARSGSDTRTASTSPLRTQSRRSCLFYCAFDSN